MKENSKLIKDEDEKVIGNNLYKKMEVFLRHACNSMLDICDNIGVIRKFIHKHKLSHMQSFKTVMRYLNDRLDHGILFYKLEGQRDHLTRFYDSNYCEYILEKSTTRYVFMFFNPSFS